MRVLRRRGYRIRDRNVRCPMGELDLVAEDGGTLVFLEVKTRSTSDYGGPFEAISPPKRRRLQRVAVYYPATPRFMDPPRPVDPGSRSGCPARPLRRGEVLGGAFCGGRPRPSRRTP